MSLGLSPRLHNKSVHLNGKPVLQVSGLENLGSESLMGKLLNTIMGIVGQSVFGAQPTQGTGGQEILASAAQFSFFNLSVVT